MRIMKALLICLVAALVVMGCNKKMAAPEASPAPATEQTQEMTKPNQATAAASVEEVTLNLTGVT
jgi:PBP1b-binding outer membrane lipoprotein LpoB